MTHNEMLSLLQADVDAWPQRVKEAGVKNSAGAAYVPLARNNEILRTPDDPEATYAYMVRAWHAADSEAGWGSDGWYRIIKQAGPELTWEWLMVEENRAYTSLFPDAVRDRVRKALDADAGYLIWIKRREDADTAQRATAERVARIREEMRSGTRERLSLPELDAGL